MAVAMLGSLLVAAAGYIRHRWFADDDDVPSVMMDPRVQRHMALYRARAARRRRQRDHAVVDTTTSPQRRRPPHVLSSDYADPTPCDLTVLFLDPRLANHHDQAATRWFALESAAVNLWDHNACMALLTTSCEEEDSARRRREEDVVRDAVYGAALPWTRQRMDDGRVRLSFIHDHAKYHLRACDDLGNNPSSAFMNARFWNDEFVSADADAVLVLQDDAVLCRPPPADFDWTRYAYVGAVWPRTATTLLPHPPEGMCRGMPALYRLLTLRIRSEEEEEYRRLGLVSRFPDPCADGRAPVGNGGLSWRSRAWMRKAIATCPHVKWSGLDEDALAATPLRAMDETNEDYYFGTLLRGMGAPLPSASVAADFAVESLFPADVAAMYGTSTEERPPPANVPVGFHKPWWYHSNEVLLSPAMQRACPFLPFIFEPDESRYH